MYVRRSMSEYRQLVLAGAGHAHMLTMHHIAAIRERGHRVTVIGPDDRHYYSGMGPGMLGGTYTPEQISFDTRKIVERQGDHFIRDSVLRIDSQSRVVHLVSGAELSFDILSCNLGSTTDSSFPTSDACPVFTIKPIRNLLAASNYIQRQGKSRILRIAIIGGGPSAAEVSGNVLHLAGQTHLITPQITVFCRSTFMAGFPPSVRTACHDYLTGRGIVIREHTPVVGVENGTIRIGDGRKAKADTIFAAHGIQPSSVFASSGIETGPDGGLAVNGFLQSVSCPEIFGGGDCIHFCPQPLDKVGVYAVRQNPVLYHNLIAALEGRQLREFVPGGGYLLIFNLGGGYGVLQKGRLFWQGRLAFRVKDYIDKRFMNKFQ